MNPTLKGMASDVVDDDDDRGDYDAYIIDSWNDGKGVSLQRSKFNAWLNAD